jgi:putative transposase
MAAHLVRNPLKFVRYKDRRQVAADLKRIHQAGTLSEAESQLASFARTWDEPYPMIHRSWSKLWEELSGFLAYPPEIRRAIYTTNAIEPLNGSLRRILKTQHVFASGEAATKPMYLALRNIAKRWTMPIIDWQLALHQFAILFEGRAPISQTTKRALTQKS